MREIDFYLPTLSERTNIVYVYDCTLILIRNRKIYNACISVNWLQTCAIINTMGRFSRFYYTSQPFHFVYCSRLHFSFVRAMCCSAMCCYRFTILINQSVCNLVIDEQLLLQLIQLICEPPQMDRQTVFVHIMHMSKSKFIKFSRLIPFFRIECIGAYCLGHIHSCIYMCMSWIYSHKEHNENCWQELC